jgi:hypothetical protein
MTKAKRFHCSFNRFSINFDFHFEFTQSAADFLRNSDFANIGYWD